VPGPPPHKDTVNATTHIVDSDPTTVVTGRRDEPNAETFREGDTIDGKYNVVQVFGGSGKSGMGVVYIVEIGGRRLALKSIQRRYAKDLSIVERFLREARTWMLLGFHPHIVHAYRIDIIDAAPFLFLEYIAPDERDAATLADYLRYGPLPIEQAMRYAIHCATGMQRATEAIPKLVHRDLKPENFLIAKQDVLKVTDFGLVRTQLAREFAAAGEDFIALDEAVTAFGANALGTPAYMAPEQFDGADQVGIPADIYAFGCCFYQAIAGRRVFDVQGKSGIQMVLEFRDQHKKKAVTPLRDRNADCPGALEAIVMRCLEKDPGMRWPDWPSLREALLDVYESHCGACYLSVPVPEPSPMEVAAQIQSMTLLDGFSRAIHLRALRERHDTRPYEFHLALASFFHCHDEPGEAQRQAERATRAQGGHDGYEAVSRLAAYYLDQGKTARADELVADYLRAHPNGLDRVLEAAVRIAIAKDEFDRARTLLDAFTKTARGRDLLVELLKASGQTGELETLLKCELTDTLDAVREAIANLDANDEPAWARDGDPALLAGVLKELDRAFNERPLESATHAYWPDVLGDPDFAGPMARLSWLFGELAQLEGTVPDASLEAYGRIAARLDYPKRRTEYLERDERWLWQHDPALLAEQA
jgi:serine/threonine protein kinase